MIHKECVKKMEKDSALEISTALDELTLFKQECLFEFAKAKKGIELCEKRAINNIRSAMKEFQSMKQAKFHRTHQHLQNHQYSSKSYSSHYNKKNQHHLSPNTIPINQIIMNLHLSMIKLVLILIIVRSIIAATSPILMTTPMIKMTLTRELIFVILMRIRNLLLNQEVLDGILIIWKWKHMIINHMTMIHTVTNIMNLMEIVLIVDTL